MVIGASLLLYSHSNQMLSDKVDLTTKQTVVQTVDSLDRMIRNYQNLTYTVITDRTILDQLQTYGEKESSPLERFTASRKIAESLSIRFFSNGDIRNVHIIPLDPASNEISTSAFSPESKNYRTEAWFQKVIAADGECVWLETRKAGYSRSGQSSFAVSRLMKLDSGIKYMLLAEINTSVLNDTLAEIKLGDSGEMVMLTAANRLLSTAKREAEEDEYHIALMPGLTAHGTARDNTAESGMVSWNGSKQLVVAGRMATTGWLVEAVIPVTEVAKDTTRIRNTMLISLAGITVVIMLFNYFMQRRRNELNIRYMAYHDHLTDLANRKLFYEAMEREISGAQPTQPFAVLFMDLDRFKLINDTFGHAAGDQMLKEVARRLKLGLGSSCTIARFDGDEFLILIPDCVGRKEELRPIVEQIMAWIQQPVLYHEKELSVNVSIGISRFPEDGLDVPTLIKNADTAMYSVKENGRSSYQFYNTAMAKKTYERLALERDLRLALERKEFLLHYQPQIGLETGMVGGIEALLRWRHPERGLVSPEVFIPVAEESRLIVPIGEWVLYTACKQNKAWQDAGLPKVQVAVNLSIHQFQHAEIVDTIARILRETGLSPQYLELEITESIAMHDVEQVIRTLQALWDMGVNISIDDFGTGYSSLNYLKHFPIHRLKIDKSFLDDMVSNAKEREIVAAIIVMAHSLGLQVTAEGAESLEQVHILNGYRCDDVQGYIFSQPLPARAFAELLEKRKVYYWSGKAVGGGRGEA
ncbi:EAL domain-containing protein [Paenibacillus cremeus]|uniref:EAL domain-containing protein n=1 Tax=Paenibacillus cremeus TaxID=2163881 RepID=A0A559KBI0_9BACL|nr:EAL domain-containing protein [Paenibacillus cremeus]